MQNTASQEAPEPTAPVISADFLTGSTEIGLDRIRTRLLDLTNRNKLLNFRHSNASSLRVVNVPVDPVFARLRDGGKLAFLPVPEPDFQLGETMPARDYADELGWDTSFDLGETSEDEAGSCLPVLLYQEALDRVSRKIATAARTLFEESGTNMLFLVFGFLEWQESDDSSQPHLAPLVVLPVTIERTGGKGKAVEAILEYSGDDIDTNLSLAEKMRRDFGLEMPLWEEEDTPERYFAKFDEILKLKKRWSIRRQITLAVLSFGKLLMYRDLDPKTWPPGQSIAAHPLVRELFEGSKNSTIEMAEEYPIDEPELKADVPLLIRDADSSQHSALIHALRGQNLVIEGPPGTGKSQTITNLIAAALAKGKTVLFVAEKLAALEVVRRRLDDAGLGIFCLEVHSHKTKKNAMIHDIAQRVAMKGTFHDPRDLDLHLSIVEEKKHLLTQYVSLINKTIEPFGATIFQILWARDQFGQEIGPHRERLGQLILPMVVQFNPTHYAQAEQSLSVFAQHLSLVLAAAGDSLEQHPFAWVAQPLGFAEEEKLLGLLEAFRANLNEAEGYCRHLQKNCAIALPRSIHGLESAAQTLARLPQSGASLMEGLLTACQNAETRQRLAAFVGYVESYRRSSQRLASSSTNVAPLLDEQNTADLSGAFQCLRQWGLEANCVAGIKDILALSRETLKHLKDAHSSFRMLLGVTGCDAPATLASATYVLETIRIVEASPFERLHLRHAVFEEEGTKPLVETARTEAASLKRAEALLGQEFDLSLASAQPPSHLLECAAIIDGASPWQRWFGGDYKRAVSMYRRLANGNKKSDRSDMSRSLRSIAEHLHARERFDSHPAYRETLGGHFQGVGTAWDDLRQLIVWYEEVFIALPEHHAPSEPFRQLLFTARTERLKALKANVVPVEEQREALSRIVARITDFTRSVPSQRSLLLSGSFEDILACLQQINRDLEDVLYTVAQAEIRDEVVLGNIPDIVASATECHRALAAVQSANDLPALLGEAYRGVHTDIEPIRHTLAFANSVASGILPPQTAKWLLCPQHNSRLTDLRSWLTGAHNCSTRIRQLTAELATISGSPVWSINPDAPWGSLQALAEHALSSPEELSRWKHFLRLQIRNREDGFDRLTTLAETGALQPQELLPAFRFVFHNTLARSVFAEHTDLSQATGVTQELLRQQFAWADRQAIRLYSERVGALIDQRPVPPGNKSGPVGTLTDMALIRHEANKQTRHIPIRQLILRSANALVALKPCFMMGPLSVAQYLAPGTLTFDLVVMDEASQLKPEDAIGAVARGGQVVIVGDPKQLPPTNFFERVSADGEEDTPDDVRGVVEDGESILDVASTLFQPVRRLRWHYRSRHHSLIAFSNEEFYDGNLIIFPSAYHQDDSLGVKHHFVRDGVFDNGRNPPEAAIVVEAALQHMREHPDESLGIVTLNFGQMELVDELLDRKLLEDPAAIAFQERMSGGQEKLFIKNLENVQGDERDVIFISTTYGPDTRGNQYQRFGPINGPTGHRRLNVLFTRAKKRTVVFSSLDPDRIQTTPNSPWGVRALKQYLTYARTGILQQADSEGDQPTNDFERSVGSVLKEKGYEVVPQVGVAGFFIDLGVKHPTKPGAFLLGIECDGASYHSGRSARDRDRLRQEILENLGWKIHRVWSTDWFRSRDSEVKRLLRRVEELVSQNGET